MKNRGLNFYANAAGMGRLESLAMGDSPLHALHPGVKILSAFVFIVTVLSFPNNSISGLAPFVFYPAVLAAVSGTPWKLLVSRFLISLPFALFGALANLVTLRTVAFYAHGFPVTEGMLSFVSILFRAFLAVTAALLLAATTPFPALISQLTRFGMPKIFGMQLALTWRYVSVLFSEAAAMYTAYMLRSRARKGIRMRDMGGFLGQLLLRSFDRAGRVYRAMKCRGFDGTCRAAAVRRPLRPVDWVYGFAVCGLALFLRVCNTSELLGRLAARLAGKAL
ncbi:MAG: cobalt ECF transporter T component CbiQ [Treponematales bacterium]